MFLSNHNKSSVSPDNTELYSIQSHGSKREINPYDIEIKEPRSLCATIVTFMFFAASLFCCIVSC